MVLRGLTQLRRTADPALWGVFVDDLLTPEGVLAPPGSEVHRRVRSPLRSWVALRLLEASGRAPSVLRLDLSEPRKGMPQSRRRTRLECLDMLTGLTHLRLDGCSELVDIEEVAAVPTLTHVDLRGCVDVDITPLLQLPRLEWVGLPYGRTGGIIRQRLQLLGLIPSLRGADLGWVPSSSLRLVSAITGQRLTLRSASSDLRWLAGMTQLTHLDLDTRREPLSLAPLRDLPLVSLTLRNARGLESVQALDGLSGLQHLALHRCTWRGLSGIATQVPELRTLELSPSPADLTPLLELPRLQTVRAAARPAVEPSVVLLRAVAPRLDVELFDPETGEAACSTAPPISPSQVDTVVDATGATRLDAFQALVTETGDPTRAIALFRSPDGAPRERPRTIAAGLDRKLLAALRRLLRSDPAQALSLVAAIDSPALWRMLTWGLSIDEAGRVHVMVGSELHKRLKAKDRCSTAATVLALQDRLHTTTALELHHAVLPTRGLFAATTALRALRLWDSTLGADALTPLSSLERLELTRCRADHLDASLPRLRHLSLSECQLEAFDLRGMPLLETLSISDIPHTRRQLRGLEGALHLRELDLERCSLPSLAPLARLPALTSLRMRWTASPADCEALLSIPSLRELELDDSCLPPPVRAQLRARPGLELRLLPPWR